MGDLDGDGRDDLCARGAAGITCVRAAGTSFSAPIAGPPLSDMQGWADVAYYSTLRVAGPPRARTPLALDAGVARDAATAPDGSRPPEPVVDGGPGIAPGGIEGGCGCRAGRTPEASNAWFAALAVAAIKRRGRRA